MPDLNKPNAKGKTIRDYLPAAMQKLGMANQQKPAEETVGAPKETIAFGGGKEIITKKKIEEILQTLKDYKAGKQNLERRIVEEERWWRLRHWDAIRGKNKATKSEEVRPEPTSAWLFNSLANKHADIMDNYPEPNVLPREKSDEKEAQILSSVLPVVFERNDYEQTFSQAAWYKLKHGVAAKGVFWNPELENGLGDVDIKFIDLLNIFYEPGVTDIQKSRNLFIVDLVDNDILEQQYPHLKGKLQGKVIDVNEYVHDDTVDVSKKSLVVDWYYKKRDKGGKTVLHLVKLVGSHKLYASEEDPEYAERGYYDHGKYPVVFDVLYPEEGTPVGFGLIAVMQSPQLYIDKLSQVILENSMMSAKVRYFVKNGAAINETEFLDWSKPLVHYEGDPNNIQPVQVQQVGGNVLNVLQMKIDELKETSANRDFNQGGTGKGVTSGAALSVLVETGNKQSRDNIGSMYRSFTQENYLTIDVMRQFYDEPRTFRITGAQGGYEYIQYSNAGLQGQPIPPAYAGQELEPGYQPATRVPIFDVVIKPQKRNPYSKLAQNELAKELYQMGFFNPQLAEQVMTALEMMDFDGEEKVKEKVQQGQTLVNQMAMMQQQMNKMGLIIYKLTGNDVLGLTEGMGAQGAVIAKEGAASGSGGASGLLEANNSYGERLAQNARANVGST